MRHGVRCAWFGMIPAVDSQRVWEDDGEMAEASWICNVQLHIPQVDPSIDIAKFRFINCLSTSLSTPKTHIAQHGKLNLTLMRQY